MSPTATKKAPSKARAAKKGGAEETLAQKVVRLRDSGLGWNEVAEQLEIGIGKAAHLYETETVPAADRITAASDEALGRLIVRARDKDQLSWGSIAARAGVPESKVRRLYSLTSGVANRGLRIGKGGRYPGENGTAAPATKKGPATKKAAAAKKATAARPEPEKVTAAQARKALAEMSLAELKARLQGKKITINRDEGGTERVGVRSVKSAKDGTLNFTDEEGKSRSVLFTYIKSATR